MGASNIGDNYRRIRDSLPPEVAIVVAAKGRSAAEVAEVIAAGASIIGHNYVQDAERMRSGLEVTDNVEWHLIGHLQRNKVGRALHLFNVIQTVDSVRLGEALDRRAKALALEGPVRVYMEVNVGGEVSKSGVPVGEARDLVLQLGQLGSLRVEGLMTVEPFCEDPEEARPYFRQMRELFEELRSLSAGPPLQVLSMGMSNSYCVAVEEGANMVRLGTAIFGPRES